jgi:hypothetical protein
VRLGLQKLFVVHLNNEEDSGEHTCSGGTLPRAQGASIRVKSYLKEAMRMREGGTIK